MSRIPSRIVRTDRWPGMPLFVGDQAGDSPSASDAPPLLRVLVVARLMTSQLPLPGDLARIALKASATWISPTPSYLTIFYRNDIECGVGSRMGAGYR